MLLNATILAFAAGGCLTYPCLAGDPVVETIELLRHFGKLPRLSSELKARVIASLPKEGEVRNRTAVQRQKIAALVPVLRAHGRDTDYLIKVVESPQARLGIYARAAILITDTALRVLTAPQLQAAVAHEIGHEYVWDEYDRARKEQNWPRLRELELVCDGFGVATLVWIAADTSLLIDALRIMETSDRSAGLFPDPTHDSHPRMLERARFHKEVAKRLAAISLVSRR